MPEEPTWRFGPETRKVHQALYQKNVWVDESSNIYLDDAFLHDAGIQHIAWDLAETHDFFQCMTKKEFASLQPSEPIEPFLPYEAIEPPSSAPPSNVRERERCATAIALWFKELHASKIATDGYGCNWPDAGSFWVPRVMHYYEEYLYNGSRAAPNIPWKVFQPFKNTSNKSYPHQVYYGWHADDGKEGVLLRSELQIFLTVMRERMQEAEYCLHIAPVLMLSIHSTKARIMIAHFKRATGTLDVKCSPYTQFDGYGEASNGGDVTKSAHGISRPPDFDIKRDLFFRWLNPACQGNTFIDDPNLGPEYVMRVRKGVKKLVKKRRALAGHMISSSSSSTESSENPL